MSLYVQMCLDPRAPMAEHEAAAAAAVYGACRKKDNACRLADVARYSGADKQAIDRVYSRRVYPLVQPLPPLRAEAFVLRYCTELGFPKTFIDNVILTLAEMELTEATAGDPARDAAVAIRLRAIQGGIMGSAKDIAKVAGIPPKELRRATEDARMQMGWQVPRETK